LIYTGQTHAALYPCQCPVEPDGGIARRAAKIKEIRRADPNIIVLDRIYKDFKGLDIFLKDDPVLPDNGIDGHNWRDDFQLTFAGNMAYFDDNPLWIFTEDRYGYATNNSYFLNLLSISSDPRLTVYDDGDYYIGGPALGYPSSPALFISYFELLFIKAECLMIEGDLPGAATAYNDAVAASLDKWDVTDAAWLATNAAETAATITLAKIMNAKYVAMYAQGEAWSDYRRYQFTCPALTPPVNNQTNGVQPSSYPYPTDEKVTNGANVPTRSGITAKLWAFQ
jgi:hypothetical protein